LHSLSGVVPIGAFLLEHFISNAEAFKGPIAYGKQVEFLNSLPAVFLLELFFIWIPILYHGLYGIYIWYQGETNVADYPWTGNWLYTTQRWTGIIALIFMVQHTYFLRFTGVHLPTHPMQSFAKVQAEFQNPWMIAFYCNRHHRRLLALQLRPVAVRREVGHHHRRKQRAAALAISASRWRSAWFLGRRGQHVRIPEHAAAASRFEYRFGKHRNAIRFCERFLGRACRVETGLAPSWGRGL
jgi:succinate dehydrogenase/fumarate reductase cytochrome b subunit (b558 family)